MGNFFSDDSIKTTPYLSSYSVCASSSSSSEIEAQIAILEQRKAKICVLQGQCLKLQESSSEVVKEDGVFVEELGLKQQHANLVKSVDDLGGEILRLRQLRIDAELRAVLTGELDGCENGASVGSKTGKTGAK